MLYLHHDLKNFFTRDKPLFEQLMSLEGECYREMDGRKTQKVVIGGNVYFIKQHTGIGWKEISKNLIQGKQPVISAKNEWQALQALEKIGIHVPKVVAYGEQGVSPAGRQSFVLMEALQNTTSLEEVATYWQTHRPSFYIKNHLIREVARMTRLMHQHQINHRDLYICHFLLAEDKSSLYLIDLHRAKKWRRLPERWKVKDLAALYFSSMDAGLSQRDYYRFIKAYHQLSLRDVLTNYKHFWLKVKNRGEKLYREHQ